MKSKENPQMTSADSPAREGEKEIQNFLRACRSYPARFASNPRISFEQHLFSFSSDLDAPSRERRSERH
jgi:hypothetical protein